ncbi:hypothetical protein MLD38_039418 [Melastoma candidum]|uniref:Uncharacterized protein n=1 Tax=Melastoma candidum TaxID=119954 RepID=A0ACB9L213_9MYRT|nr:hypothetical protein MLD38_039418 [Melastoma candidum]
MTTSEGISRGIIIPGAQVGKRSFGDIEDDLFGNKKANVKAEDNTPGAATIMILSLRPRFVINYIQTLKSLEESLRERLEKAKKKEAAFIVTFAKREQEIAELKARRLLLDPAIHEEFMRLKNLVEEKDKKVKELQDKIAAVNFTRQSKMGKILLAKCRTLQEENEEIGNQAAEGKIHELTMKLALQKSQNAELRSQFERYVTGLYKHLEGLTDDVVLVLQEKLEEKDRELQKLKDQLQEKDDHEDRSDLVPLIKTES